LETLIRRIAKEDCCARKEIYRLHNEERNEIRRDTLHKQLNSMFKMSCILQSSAN